MFRQQWYDVRINAPLFPDPVALFAFVLLGGTHAQASKGWNLSYQTCPSEFDIHQQQHLHKILWKIRLLAMAHGMLQLFPWRYGQAKKLPLYLSLSSPPFKFHIILGVKYCKYCLISHRSIIPSNHNYAFHCIKQENSRILPFIGHNK